MIILLEAIRDKTAEEGEAILEAVLIKPPEAKKGPRGRRRWWNVRGERVCRRSAGGGGTFEVNVSAGGLLEVCQRRCELDCSSALHLKGWLLEVCQRFAGGLLEVCQVRGTEDHQLLLPTQEENYYSHTVG